MKVIDFYQPYQTIRERILMYSAGLTQLVIHQDSHVYRVGREDPNSLLLPHHSPGATFQHHGQCITPVLGVRLGSIQLWFSRAFSNLSGLRGTFCAFSKLLSQQPKLENTFIWIEEARGFAYRLTSQSARGSAKVSERSTRPPLFPVFEAPRTLPPPTSSRSTGAPARRQAGI